MKRIVRKLESDIGAAVGAAVIAAAVLVMELEK